jgi:periplasmic divalent cation tolerance protein
MSRTHGAHDAVTLRSMREDDLLRVTTATPDLGSAKNLARSMVAARLAGNAQIVGPVVSVFRHLGEIGEGEEYRLVLSTTAAAYTDLEAALLGQHPWRNPEITAIPLAAATEGYARWLREATAPQNPAAAPSPTPAA